MSVSSALSRAKSIPAQSVIEINQVNYPIRLAQSSSAVQVTEPSGVTHHPTIREHFHDSVASYRSRV